MTYTIAAGESFNMVLSHIDHSDPATWTKKFTKEDIEKEFSGWDTQYVANPAVDAYFG
jgi:salicylate hydroxylase